MVSRRIVLSLVPVHTSKLGLRTAAAIFCRGAGGIPDFSVLVPDTPVEEAFSTTVFRSFSRAGTFTPAWMWVVWAPPTFSVPTTVGWVSQRSGWIPSLASVPEPEPWVVLADEASWAKL